MKFSGTSIALVLALVVAVSMQLTFALVPQERSSSTATCGMGCNPKSKHGCNGDCYVCDPDEALCMRPKKGHEAAPPPPPAPEAPAPEAPPPEAPAPEAPAPEAPIVETPAAAPDEETEAPIIEN